MPSLGNTLNARGNLITNLGTPVGSNDATTKQYVDSVAQGLNTKSAVHLATTANITLSGTQTIDGVVGVAGDRVLVKDQTSASQNGIYVMSASTWSRATDGDAWNELVAAYLFVEEGTVNADTGWLSTANAGGTLGTTAVMWTKFGITYSAGTGITLTGTVFSIASNAITTAMIQDNAITSAKIADGTISTNDLGNLQVTDGKIANATILGGSIATGTVTSGNIQDGTIATIDIADGAITTAKQADLSTTTGKLADGAVTTAKIGDSQITSAKIADGTIVDADLAAGAVALGGTKVTGVLPISKGGTGNATAALARQSLAATSYASVTNDVGTITSIDFAPLQVNSVYSVQVINNSTKEVWMPDITINNTTKIVQVMFGSAQVAGDFTIYLVG